MGRFLRRIVLWVVALFFGTTVLAVLSYKVLPVCFTPLMFIRCHEQHVAGEKMVLHHKWTPIEKISPHLPQAVIASEDNLFMKHNGFDWEAIGLAIEQNKTRKTPRGASTISQQTAKNVFLWPGRSYFRKGLEFYFTFLIETFWSKERIMEVYLNSIEMGKGIYGAQAVASYHFSTDAANLTRKQCATIAATLPNPLRFNSEKPSAYIVKRTGQILSLMDKIGPTDLTEPKSDRNGKVRKKSDGHGSGKAE